jgi:hypothetical protein
MVPTAAHHQRVAAALLGSVPLMIPRASTDDERLFERGQVVL